MLVSCSEVLVNVRQCAVCCRPLQCHCIIGGNHINLLHLRKVIQLEVDLPEWRRHLLSYNVLRSSCVALHPSGCALSNVHCSIYYQLDAIVQATTIYDRNTAEYTVPSEHVQRAEFIQPYLMYNYMQYTTGAYHSRKHFPSQHKLGPRTPTLDVLTMCS